MEMTLNMGAFQALDQQELFAVDGGKPTWSGAAEAATMAAWGVIGMTVGAAGGPVGMAIGAIGGAIIGYCLYNAE